jgi:hypothetical protein
MEFGVVPVTIHTTSQPTPSRTIAQNASLATLTRTLRRTIHLETATALGAICRKERPMTVAIRYLLIIGFNEHLITNLLANPPGSYRGEILQQNLPNVILGLPRSKLARKQDHGRRL